MVGCYADWIYTAKLCRYFIKICILNKYLDYILKFNKVIWLKNLVYFYNYIIFICTYLIKSEFTAKEQNVYESEARKLGHGGEVYHPTIKIVDGKNEIYIDWLMQGLNASQLRLDKEFPKIKEEVLLGKFTVKKVWDVCKAS